MMTRPAKEGGFSYPPFNNGGPNGPPTLPPSAEDVFGEPAAELFLDSETIVDVHARHLPHWQQGGLVYFVTWHTADALPASKLAELRDEKALWLSRHPKPWDAKTEQLYHEVFADRIDRWLDAGHGACVLRNPESAKTVYDSLLFFDGERYDMATFVVMPNHVHVLFRLYEGTKLEDVLKSLKGFTANAINSRLAEHGTFWQEEYWDRVIRSDRHFVRYWEYIRDNPAAVGLEQRQPWYYAITARGREKK